MKAISENIRLWWGLRERVEVFKIFYTRNLGAFYTGWPHEPALMGCESERAALANTWSWATMVLDLYQFSTFHVILYLHKSNQSVNKTQAAKASVGMERLAAISCDNTNNILGVILQIIQPTRKIISEIFRTYGWYISPRELTFFSSKILTIVVDISVVTNQGPMCVREPPPWPPRVNMSGPNYTCVECHIPDGHMYTRCDQEPQACANICQERGECDDAGSLLPHCPI